MKKFFAFFIMLVACSFIASAEHNAPVSATANFDCKVILPLSWETPENVTLEEVIAGQTRTFDAVNLNFVLNGEAGYTVDINTYGPNTVGTETLIGDWTGDGEQILVGGAHTVTYSCTGIESTDVSAHGSRIFTISVDAQYNAL